MLRVTSSGIYRDEGLFVKTRIFGHLNIFVKDANGELLRQNLFYHFKKMFDYSKKAELEPNLRKMLEIRKKEFVEACLIDADELNAVYAGLGDSFRAFLLRGLKLRISGFASGDKQKYKDGQILLLKWRKWFYENKEKISGIKGVSS